MARRALAAGVLLLVSSGRDHELRRRRRAPTSSPPPPPAAPTTRSAWPLDPDQGQARAEARSLACRRSAPPARARTQAAARERGPVRHPAGPLRRLCLATAPARSRPTGQQENLRSVSMLWQNVEHFVVDRRHGADRHHRRLRRTSKGAAVLDRRAELRHRGSGAAILAGLGIDLEKIRPGLHAATAHRRSPAERHRRRHEHPGRRSGRGGHPGLRRAGDDRRSSTSPTSSGEGQRRLRALDRYDIPAGTYPGQDEAVNTIAQPNFLAVRADVPEEDVYLITKTIYENLPFLQASTRRPRRWRWKRRSPACRCRCIRAPRATTRKRAEIPDRLIAELTALARRPWRTGPVRGRRRPAAWPMTTSRTRPTSRPGRSRAPAGPLVFVLGRASLSLAHISSQHLRQPCPSLDSATSISPASRCWRRLLYPACPDQRDRRRKAAVLCLDLALGLLALAAAIYLDWPSRTRSTPAACASSTADWVVGCIAVALAPSN